VHFGLERKSSLTSKVVQYLTHEGYVETARSFAVEVQSEKEALSLDPGALIQGFDVKQDEDAGHRQSELRAFLGASPANVTQEFVQLFSMVILKKH